MGTGKEEDDFYRQADRHMNRPANIQVCPDWQTTNSLQGLIEYFDGIVFSEPGFYLDEKDTILLLETPHKDLFTAYVYNCPYTDTIFAHIARGDIKLLTLPVKNK